jgi:hypothetical protein
MRYLKAALYAALDFVGTGSIRFVWGVCCITGVTIQYYTAYIRLYPVCHDICYVLLCDSRFSLRSRIL